MNRSIALAVGAVAVTVALSQPAFAQGTPQTAAIMKVIILPLNNSCEIYMFRAILPHSVLVHKR